MTRTGFALVCLCTVIAVLPQNICGQSSARALGMGGAHMGLASGVAAAQYNPANLGLTSHQTRYAELFALSAQVSNNSFSPDDIGRILEAMIERDMDQIRGSVPGDQIEARPRAQASLISFSNGPWAWHSSASLAAEGIGDLDLWDILLSKRALAQKIFDLEAIDGRGISYASGGISYGRQIFSRSNFQISVGATGNYLSGIWYGEITGIHEGTVTDTSGQIGYGSLQTRIAESGRGLALSLGIAAQLDSSYTIGLSLPNALSFLRWNGSPKRSNFVFIEDTITLLDPPAIVTRERHVTTDIDPFTTSLPRELWLGFARNRGKFLWAVDWRQGFSAKPGSSTKAQFSLGVEWTPMTFLPLRAGYAFGGMLGNTISVGTGLNIKGLVLDFAVMTESLGRFGGAKRIAAATTIGLYF